MNQLIIQFVIQKVEITSLSLQITNCKGTVWNMEWENEVHVLFIQLTIRYILPELIVK